MTADRLIAGRYRLTDPIGTGAMGVVWRATDVRLRRTVAVKQVLLAPGLTRSQTLEAKLRAMREGRIAARLHHPHAITVFDVAEEDGQPWLVMEYMNAPSLAAKLSGQRTLDPLEVARIGAQAAGALAAAHDAGIMHRDVKPANLLVADDGTVKITDFGISRAVGDVTVTATGFLAGTPAYLAPEVARGENPEPSSDVFALGSTLYAAVEGSPPFGESDNPLAVLHAVARAQVPEPKQAGDLGPVLMRLLSATVEGRPTMREAQQALENVGAGRVSGLSAAPASTRVMPAPGAGATSVLPGSGAATTGGGNPADATEVISTANRQAPPPPPPPPVRPRTSGTLTGGFGGGESRGRLIAVAAAAVVAVLVVVALILVNRDDGDSGSTAAPQTGSTAGAENPGGQVGQPATTDAPSTSTAPSSTPPPSSSTTTTTPPPSTTTPPPGPPTPERVAQFIQGYYGMLPGNISGAWSQLSPGYQAQTGGYGSYSVFWNGIRSVSVGAVTPNGADSAVVALTYVKTNGSTDRENRWVQVRQEGNQLLITASNT